MNERYKLAERSMENAGAYIILSKAVRGMKYGKMKIVDAFNKYVSKKDFVPEEKEMLLTNLFEVTNNLETNSL